LGVTGNHADSDKKESTEMKRVLLMAITGLALASPAIASEWWVNERPDLTQRIPLDRVPTPPHRLVTVAPPTARGPAHDTVTANEDHTLN
jgi:hypothetical protein